MRELTKKVAVVTGAASGIGLALSKRFLAEGMNVVMADVEAGALEEQAGLLDESGERVLAVATDVRKPEEVAALADRTLARFGAVHVLCNNAGVAPGGKMLDTKPEDWRWVMDVNVLGVAHGVSTFGPLMVEAGEGHIVNTASEAGLMTNDSLGMYCASKHAVVGLTESLYRELESTPVGVSVVCPNLVRTGIFHSERNRDDGAPENPKDVAVMGFLRETLVSMGIQPSDVADKVVEAIREDRFWVFTHPGTAARAGARAADIAADRNPSNPYADFDVESGEG
ncbi:MAG: SDR family NAD(P)-dependent oxidoreductase [Candidatus Binatia bacterium]|nr:SDR family NAD(P)-dependent oxidoreductase [Candidatus Binatia bacterium]